MIGLKMQRRIGNVLSGKVRKTCLHVLAGHGKLASTSSRHE
jgi:hypothetical protein